MKIYLVGGAVRDKLLGQPVKERDWVVVGATANHMLERKYRQVGKEFPVFLHPSTNEEYALARMERKINPGYKGFTFDTSPEVTLEEDLERRDLTINAMAEDETGHLIDPYHGKQDLENKILRHVSPAFAEDPVRILRVGRFYARYAQLGFHIAPETISLMQNMVEAGEVDALVAERVWKELERALGEKNPEKFFEALAACGALTKLFPHLSQNGQGMEALRAAAELQADSAVRFAALLHDIPKAKENIALLCNRYRVPNDFRELAILTEQNYRKALTYHSLSADQLLKLLSALDYFRREERFNKFLRVTAIIAKVQAVTFDPDRLTTIAQVTKTDSSNQIPLFMEQGLAGNELADRIKKNRLSIIESLLKKLHST